MNRIRIAVLATGILATAGLGVAFAASGAKEGGPAGHRMQGTEWIQRLDGNGDGLLQKSEIQAFLDTQFEAADADKDGALSQDEMRAQFAAMRDQRFEERFAALDVDKSGGLTAEEMKGRSPRMFERADADKDGVVTLDELRNAFTRRGPAAQ